MDEDDEYFSENDNIYGNSDSNSDNEYVMEESDESEQSSGMDCVQQIMEQFSTNLVKSVSDMHGLKNFVLSPICANIALALAGFGARGKVAEEIWDILRLSPEDKFVIIAYTETIEKINISKNVTVKFLNKMFISNNFVVKEDYTTLLQNEFYSTKEQLDFRNSIFAANTINNWVSSETNGRITELFTPQEIDEKTNIILANVLYFKGEWLDTFPKNKTFLGDFYTKEKICTVPFMTQKGDFLGGYVPHLFARFIELPYKDPNIIMMIILPNERDGLKDLEQRLLTTDIKDIRENATYNSVRLYLPKFKVETTIKLKEILQQGCSMFSMNADFSGISDNSIHVDDIIQKVFIEIDEAGTEAGAAAGLEFSTRSRQEYIDLSVNHPFHFKIIRNTGNNNVFTLFAGNCTSF